MLNAGLTVIAAEAAAAALALLVAVSVPWVGTVADAVNVAAVGVVDDKAPAPLTAHETPEPVESLATVALNACAWPESMVTEVGETATEIGNWPVPAEEDPPLHPVKTAVAARVKATEAAILLVLPASSKNIVELFIWQVSGGKLLGSSSAFFALYLQQRNLLANSLTPLRSFFLQNDLSAE
jgi:hypothetical protein